MPDVPRSEQVTCRIGGVPLAGSAGGAGGAWGVAGKSQRGTSHVGAVRRSWCRPGCPDAALQRRRFGRGNSDAATSAGDA